MAPRVILRAAVAQSCAVLAAVLALPAHAEDAAAFYSSHKLVLGVPNGAGGGYDVYTRTLARHLPKYIPGNPNIVVQNLPAAGGMALANQLYSTVPKDGSYIAMIRGTVVHEQVFKSPKVQFDARKFAWIGNMNSDYDACVVGAKSPVKSIEDFYKYQTAVGASGAGAQSYTFPVVYRDMLGMKFKVIAGYPGTPERMLAVERGELDGFCGVTLSTFRSQLTEQAKSGKIRLIAQAGTQKDPRYPNVPNLLDQAKTPEQRQALEFLFVPLAIGRAFAAPPGTPKDRLDVLRRGMLEAMKDPAFIQDANKVHIDIAPMDAKETAAIANQLFETPAPVVARLKAMIAR